MNGPAQKKKFQKLLILAFEKFLPASTSIHNYYMKLLFITIPTT